MTIQQRDESFNFVKWSRSCWGVIVIKLSSWISESICFDRVHELILYIETIDVYVRFEVSTSTYTRIGFGIYLNVSIISS